MKFGTIKASYLNYTIEQSHYPEDSYCHHFYKNGKIMPCTSIDKCIPRTTKKQLYRYLRYLVKTGLIQKFDQIIKHSDRDVEVPYRLNERTGEVIYTIDMRKKWGIRHDPNDYSPTSLFEDYDGNNIFWND